MQKMKFMALMLLFSVEAVAQQESDRYIEVNGDAFLDIIPDEIYVSATINEDKQENFVKVEKAFLSELKKLGIKDEDISLSDMNGEFASAWFKKGQMKKEKTYQVKLSSAEEVGAFLKLADKVGAKDTRIVRTDIRNREEAEKKVRIMAVKNAKEKAIYMSEAIDSQIGSVLLIREQHMSIYRGKQRVNDLMTLQASHTPQKMKEEVVVGFKKIRMEIKVSARFELN